MIPEWEGLEPKDDRRGGAGRGRRRPGRRGVPDAREAVAARRTSTIDTLVVNGCECEPYLTTDHRTMVDYPERVHLGIRIMMRVPRRRRARSSASRRTSPTPSSACGRRRPTDLDVEILRPARAYPQGAEKMLIEALLGREVPVGRPARWTSA